VDNEFDDGSGPKVGDGEEKACADGVYDPWHRAKPSSFGRFFNRSETPFLLIGASLIVLIIIFFLFVPRNGEDEVGLKLAFLEKRLAPIEEKLAKIPGSGGDAAARIEKQAAACDRAVDRVESVEASLTMRIDRIAQDVEKIKKDVVHIDKKAAESPRAAIPAAVETEKKAVVTPKAVSSAAVPAVKKADETAKASAAAGVQGKPAYHAVRAGETLFRISRQYNMTVDALRRLNKLTEKDVITPGQKLVVAGTAK
jgi:LysM repeat protein